MKRFADFLIFCSGANQKILKRPECARDRERFVSIGATVLLTTLMSLLSAVYALSFVFANTGIAIAGGLAWAVLIFALDRLLVSGLQNARVPGGVSPAERVRIRRHTLLSAAPRLLLAAVVGVVLAVPLQLRVLSSTVEREYRKVRAQSHAATRAAVARQYPDIARLEHANADMAAQVREADARARELRAAAINEPSGTLGGPIFEERRRAFRDARSRAIALKERYQPVIETNELRLRSLRADAQQLEERLTRNGTHAGLIERVATLQRLTAQNPEIRTFRWALTTLFILFQLAPLLVQMLSAAGPYDEFWERFETLATVNSLLGSASDLERDDMDIKKHTVTVTPNAEVPAQSLARDRHTRVRAFVCHSSDDKPAARNLCNRLRGDGVDPWLDEERILPGQDWDHEIRKAIRECDVVIVCLSRGSVRKTGYVQKEIRFAIDFAAEQPEGATFLIPAKLEPCKTPARLQSWQYVKLFEPDGYSLLLRSLEQRGAETVLDSSDEDS